MRVGLFILLGYISFPIHAQSADTYKLIDALGFQKMYTEKALTEITNELLRDGLTESQKKVAHAKVIKTLTFDPLKKDMARGIESKFTQAEIIQLERFYSTPLGMKMLDYGKIIAARAKYFTNQQIMATLSKDLLKSQPTK